ncbi:protein C3orf33 homolog isoform X4 [Oryzias latipes]|uniref:protein C3orf33 homolog isoform X4 n=1 Tax=Oryzias latipes TaxID=8090 RepID=UPI0005CB8A60|nr:protein C3orf33 homolog isoform X4 [Oryzias latipes]
MHRENVNNMPECSRETESEEAATTAANGRQTVKGNNTSHNIVSLISKIADEHISVVRSFSTCLAVAGVILIARSIKLLTKFQAAREIPALFIERNVRLRGKVHSITEKGIEVEHVPIYLPVLSTLLSKRDVSTSTMLVHLAGVELTPEGQIWLQNTLAPTQGSMWGHCMNEEVLKLGLARTAPIVGVQPESRLYWRLHKRLHRAELKAEKKGRGFWKEESPWERTFKAVRDSSIIRLMKTIFKRS